MASQRQIPGGPYHNGTDSNQRQIPGGPFVNDTEATGAVTHATTGALSSQSATVAGTAAHLTLHATSDALASQAAVIAGTATHVGEVTHETTGALASQSATIAGSATLTVPAGTHATSGALAADSATISGVGAHLTLHTTTGALAAQSAIIVGTSVKTSAGGSGATAEEIWAYEIEPGVTAKMAMQRILAVIGGKISGAGTGTETFRDINDTRDALVSVNDSNGNRTSLTWNDGP